MRSVTARGMLSDLKKTRKIICTAFGNGRKHGFRLFKESKIYIHPVTKCEVNTGYQGEQKRGCPEF